MWSDRYYYLNIYKDESLSADTDTRELMEFISGIPGLERKGKFVFRNKELFPFIELLLLKAKSLDNWSEEDSDPKRTNLIAIVCEKGKEADLANMEKVFIQIASFLKWTLVDEETGDGIENYVIWKPE